MHNDQLINRLICQARTIKQLAEKNTRQQDSKAEEFAIDLRMM